MPVGRRIYGFATDEVFFACRDRAKREGLKNVGEAFEALAIGYARGYDFVKVRKAKEHAKSENGFDNSRTALDVAGAALRDAERRRSNG